MSAQNDAAYAFCNAANALIKAMSMLNENLWRYSQDLPLAYGEEHFDALSYEFNLEPDDMAQLLRDRRMK
jgi:hypothetical protein